jgi:hypothetical protein
MAGKIRLCLQAFSCCDWKLHQKKIKPGGN